jgi:hypothetical protein
MATITVPLSQIRLPDMPGELLCTSCPFFAARHLKTSKKKKGNRKRKGEEN